jgi:hypothetical protein
MQRREGGTGQGLPQKFACLFSTLIFVYVKMKFREVLKCQHGKESRKGIECRHAVLRLSVVDVVFSRAVTRPSCRSLKEAAREPGEHFLQSDNGVQTTHNTTHTSKHESVCEWW